MAMLHGSYYLMDKLVQLLEKNFLVGVMLTMKDVNYKTIALRKKKK